MVESMQQSSATPSLHLGFLGLRKIVACSQPYLAVASCTYSFWHGVIPTSYFIFNDFYTCIYTYAILRTYMRMASHRALQSRLSLDKKSSETSVKINKNEVGCRDDTVPKIVDTRRHCEEE